jgi:protein ImuB
MQATADLFAALTLPAAASLPASVPAPAPLPAPTPVPASAPAPASVHAQHLWYAVVFPQLDQSARSTAVLHRLCLQAQRFTPWVSLEMPNALLLEIRGSVNLFGSLAALHADIDAAWRQFELPACSAVAPSSVAALWCARAGERVCIEAPERLAGALAHLPVAALAWDAERLRRLRALGVTRLGELLRLPRAGVARRFGPAAVLELDRALARQAAPRRAFVPRERFHERCDFEAEIESVAYLGAALEPLIERCARFLRIRQAGVQDLQLRLWHRARPTTRVRLGLASVTSERDRLRDVVHQKLSRLELQAPCSRLELRSGPLRPLAADSLDVFAASRGGAGRDTAPQLVERLRARLGEKAVYRICALAEHRPEAAWRRVDELPLDEFPAHGAPAPDMPRPVWLLDAPAALAARTDWVLEQGPERIESGWWDGRGIARDYYIAGRAGGPRLWVFRERQAGTWHVHGLFA